MPHTYVGTTLDSKTLRDFDDQRPSGLSRYKFTRQCIIKALEEGKNSRTNGGTTSENESRPNIGESRENQQEIRPAGKDPDGFNDPA